MILIGSLIILKFTALYECYLGKRSKSSQRIESESDSNENSDSREPEDDPDDIQPIGKYRRLHAILRFRLIRPAP